ncbi:hypothetical protein PX699_25985 [Sphingobium sp. H39-3-25]|uniref:hypothetical protein n=1 Tax=Sphingobium arseniciresistens TaxID=3030834 RepID=UPI0023BA12EF|nr:hypothetical protein [Sphingobium arseniciresistens]
MNLNLLVGGALLCLAAIPATASAETVVHQADVAHAAMPVKATYKTQWAVTTDEIAPKHASRQILPICRWQANVVVAREVHGANGAIAALGKPVHQLAGTSGTEMGRCADAKGRINAEVARHAGKQQSASVQAAQQDHGALMSELDGVARLAGKAI